MTRFHLRFPILAGVLLLLACVCFVGSAPSGVTNWVTTGDDSGPGSLRQAVEELNAASGGTILFSSNVSMVLFTNSLSITNNLQIIGPGADKLSLASTSGLYSIQFSQRATCVVAGVTFSNVASVNAGALNLMSCKFRKGGLAFRGSAIDNSGALTMSNTAMSESRAKSGGAIYNRGSLVIDDCTFTGNYADEQYFYPGGRSSEGRGGAICSDSGAVTLKRCRFVGNASAGGRGSSGPGFAGRGGALFIGGGSLNADGCVFERNSARGGEGGGFAAGESSGGAVCITNAVVEFRNCVFTNNQVLGANGGTRDNGGSWVGGTPALAAGGAVSLESGLLSLINASFSANCVTGGIGGSYIFPGIACSPSYGGSALGGAVYVARGTTTLDHCTVTANWAVGLPGGYCMDGPPSTGRAGDGIGGGIYNDRGSMWFNSVTFLANQKKSGDGAAMPSDYFENAPRMTGVQRAGNAILVSFTTQTGQTYGVQYRTSDLRTWLPLPGVIAGTGGIATFTDSGAGTLSNRFYRVYRNP